MAVYYVDTVFRHVSQTQVVDALKQLGRTAFVLPEMTGHVTVFDQLCDEELDDQVTDQFATAMTALLDCAALSFLNDDNGILWMHTHQKGKLLDVYVSSPETAYFTHEIENVTGNAKLICDIWQKKEVASHLEHVFSDYESHFADDRHRAILSTLGISSAYVLVRLSWLVDEFPNLLCDGCVVALTAEQMEEHFGELIDIKRLLPKSQPKLP